MRRSVAPSSRTSKPSHDGKVKFRNRNVVKNDAGDPVVMGRNMRDRDRRRARARACRYKLPYGAKVLVDDGDKVERATRSREWDPYTLPIITEVDGTANYVDLVDGVTVREETDEATGMTSQGRHRLAQSSRKVRRSAPAIVAGGQEGRGDQLANGGKRATSCPVDAILSVENGAEGPGR